MPFYIFVCHYEYVQRRFCGEVRAKLDLSNLGTGLTAYPYVLFFEQSKNEQLLYNYLKQNGKTVRRTRKLFKA